MQFSIDVHNGLLDRIETAIDASAVIKLWTGTAPVNCAAPDTGSLLAEFDLAPEWCLPAVGGVLTFANLPLSVADGIVGYFRIYGGGTCHMQGAVTTMAGGGEMVCGNTNVAAEQNLKMWTVGLSAPGA